MSHPTDRPPDRPGSQASPPLPAVPVQVPGPPPPVSPWKRRRGLAVGIVVGIVFTFAVLAVIGYLVDTNTTLAELPLEEDFSSGAPTFSTDDDPLARFRVVDGAYRILIKDARAPQVARHIFAHSYDGLRFEATVVLPDRAGALMSLGCWSREHAYVLGLATSGQVLLFETVSEQTGERRALTRPVENDAVRPRGEPNRLRLDCVGGGDEPTILSAWVNGQPIVSVAVPDGFDSFDAVGFFVLAVRDGAEVVVDDVTAAAQRPAPAVSPVPPIEIEPPATPTPRASPSDVGGGHNCQGETATIAGTPDGDELTGTFRPDVIAGLGGDDVIRALDGGDIVCGGNGDDTVYTNWGPDSVYGGPGDDELSGGPGSDTLDSSTGNDTLNGYWGTDTCLNGEDNAKCEALEL